jgi:hypothetical protein
MAKGCNRIGSNSDNYRSFSVCHASRGKGCDIRDSFFLLLPAMTLSKRITRPTRFIRETIMEQIIARIASAAGISEDLAMTAVKIILNFLAKEAPEDKMNMLVSALGAQNLMDQAAEAGNSGGGLLGGLMGAMGGMGGAMAALNQLTSEGLSMGEVQTVATELISAAKENADESLVDDVVNSVPALSQIL